MLQFNIPRKLVDLEREREQELWAANVPDHESVEPGHVDRAYKESTSALSDGPLAVIDTETFESTYVVIRSMELLSPRDVLSLAKLMSHNLTVVASGLTELEGLEKGHVAVMNHRSAIQAYAFFLHILHEQLHSLAIDGQKANVNTGAGVKKRGGKAKGAALDEITWMEDWPNVAERIIKAMRVTLAAELDRVLYHSQADKFRLIEVCVLTAARCLEDSGSVKRSVFNACLEVLALAATLHATGTGCLEVTSASLFHLVKAHDHGPEVAGRAAAHAAAAHNSTSLAKALLGKFCEVEPEEYDEMAKRDTKPVKRAAELLSEMAEANPAVMHAAMSQLNCYFGCTEATTIRSNLVACVGRLMEWYMGREMNEKGSRVLQGSMQNAMKTLLQRINDKTALVRKAAINTIDHLVASKCWPLEFYAYAAGAAVARLDDGALAAGAALSLLCTLAVASSTDKLTDTFLLATINSFEEQLKGMQPDVVKEDGEDEGPQWEAGTLGGSDEQQPADPTAPRGSQAGPTGAIPPSQPDIIQPTQADDLAGGGATQPGKDNGGMTYSQVQHFIKVLKGLLELSRTLAAALPELEGLLSSESVDVAEKAIQLLTLCSQKQLQGVEDSWRRVWHLVFSSSEKVRLTVLDAFYNYLVPHESSEGCKTQQEKHYRMMKQLLRMTDGTALCDQEALEELMRMAVTRGPGGEEPILAPEFLRRLLREMFKEVDHAVLLAPDGGEQAIEKRKVAGHLSLLCRMVTRHVPELVVTDVEQMVACLKRAHLVVKDALLVRNIAAMLGDLAPALHAAQKGRSATGYQPASHIPNALSNLISVLLSTHLPDSGEAWPSAAQAAVAALYQLHPEPHALLQPLLQHLAAETVEQHCPASRVTRTVFLVGCIATQQLALVDALAKRIRRHRAAEEKKAAERGAAKPSEDDMDAQLGTGQAREHMLDALQDDLEAKIMGGRSLIGAWGKLVSALCHNPVLLAQHPPLAAAAMSTLAKLMAMDPIYCEDNCPLFFTRLAGGHRSAVRLAPQVRCGMLVALGDLGRRHPNVTEPWTEHMFACLSDENEEVAKTCLRILAHLVLSDLTKPKGHMAHVARCLVARSAAVRDLAVRLFNSLAAKQVKGGANKVCQYLPEIISAVTRGEPMSAEEFKTMMQRLLGYVKQDKNIETLKARLCERFENVVCEFASVGGQAAMPMDASGAEYDAVVREWRSIADCLALMPYSEKGLRACMERMRCYKHALGDEHVYKVFKDMAEHGRRGSGRTAELKQEVTEYEARLDEAHASLREEQLQQAAAAAAAKAAAAKAGADPQQVDVAAIGAAEATAADPQQAELDNEMGDGGNDPAEDAQNVANVVEQADVGIRVKPDPDSEGQVQEQARGPTQDLKPVGGVGAGEVASEGGETASAARHETTGESEDDTAETECGDAKAGGDEEEVGEELDADGSLPGGDADMEWEEDGPEDGHGTPREQQAGTPMAITPLPAGAQQKPQGDDMAWSPAPPLAIAVAAAAGMAFQENVNPMAFGGFHVKPDPGAQEYAPMGPVMMPGGVVGIVVKPDPDARRH